MNLTHTQRTMLNEMPDLSFGQDRNDYCRAVVEWAREQGYPLTEALNLAEIKWQSWEVQQLIDKVEAGSTTALQEAVTMLLRDRYIV